MSATNWLGMPPSRRKKLNRADALAVANLNRKIGELQYTNSFLQKELVVYREMDIKNGVKPGLFRKNFTEKVMIANAAKIEDLEKQVETIMNKPMYQQYSIARTTSNYIRSVYSRSSYSSSSVEDIEETRRAEEAKQAELYKRRWSNFDRDPVEPAPTSCLPWLPSLHTQGLSFSLSMRK